jgi:hypothetical protein
VKREQQGGKLDVAWRRVVEDIVQALARVLRAVPLEQEISD